jgi:hypothetical protein
MDNAGLSGFVAAASDVNVHDAIQLYIMHTISSPLRVRRRAQPSLNFPGGIEMCM